MQSNQVMCSISPLQVTNSILPPQVQQRSGCFLLLGRQTGRTPNLGRVSTDKHGGAVLESQVYISQWRLEDFSAETARAKKKEENAIKITSPYSSILYIEALQLANKPFPPRPRFQSALWILNGVALDHQIFEKISYTKDRPK